MTAQSESLDYIERLRRTIEIKLRLRGVFRSVLLNKDNDQQLLKAEASLRRALAERGVS